MTEFRRLGFGFAVALCLLLSACASKTPKAAPMQSHPSLQQGQDLFLAGRFEEAIDPLTAAARSGQPGVEPQALSWRGKCYVELNRWNEAQEDFQRGLQLSKMTETTAICAEGLGDAQRALGRNEEAVASYQKALREGAGKIDEGLVRYKLGVALVRQGRWADGREQFRIVAGQFSSGRYADKARRVLDHVGDHFVIQIGSFSSWEAADKELKRVTAAGYAGRVLERPGATTAKFAVTVGRYVTWDSAQSDLAGIRNIYKDAFLVP